MSARHHINQQEAMEVLGPYGPVISEALRHAMAQVGHIDQQVDARLVPRTMGCMLLDVANDYLRRQWVDDPRVEIVDAHNTTWFVFDGRVQLRIKSVDEEFRPRNRKSKRQERIEAQLSVSDIFDAPMLLVGYRPDWTLLDIKHAHVIFRRSGDNIWVSSLEQSEGSADLITPDFIEPIHPTERRRVSRVRLKGADEQTRQGGDGQ